ncbi:MAG: septum formation initiator family protein [Candidatus Woesebacteria bacterium]|jgi:cell division protein FtsB
MNRFLSQPIILIAFSILSLSFILSLKKTENISHQSQKNVEILQNEVKKQSENIQELENKIAEADYPLTKEKIQRNDLLMQRPGEYIIQIPTETKNENKKIAIEIESPWQEWKKLLFGD